MGDFLTEIQPASLATAPISGGYASAADLTTIDDLREEDVTILRWRRDGQPLRLRVRALDLDQQDRIDVDALVKNKKTGTWERSNAAYCAATLREAVLVPKLTPEQAQAMRRHNPRIIEALVRYIWLLSALDDVRIEALVHAEAGLEPEDAAQPADGSDEDV